MPRKSVLNMTSRKKRDTMTTVTNTTFGTPLGGTTYLQQPAELIGGVTYIMPWVCTARAQTGAAVLPATRSSSTCYMRGLKEHAQFQTNDGTNWQWRRIAFTLKDQVMYGAGNAGVSFWRSDAGGVRRLVNNINGDTLGLYMIDQIFRGTQGVDWSSYFNAPLDSRRTTVKYDRTMNLSSGNANGIMRHFKMWHPMNKNICYDDDEDGAQIRQFAFSTNDKRGMGDYLIIDIIAAGTGSTNSNRATLSIDSTLYWHEK